jgi:hypothetical protein
LFFHHAIFNVKSQTVASREVIWIDARGVNGADMQERVRAAFVVSDETKAAGGIPHFQDSGSHLFPFCFQPHLKMPIANNNPAIIGRRLITRATTAMTIAIVARRFARASCT